MTDNILTGQLGESICSVKLLKMDIPCSLVHLQKTDILALKDGKPLRIQVKSSRMKRAYERKGREYFSYHFSIASGGHPKQPLTKDVCDIVAFVAIDKERVIFKKVDDLQQKLTKHITPDDFFIGCDLFSWKKCFDRDETL